MRISGKCEKNLLLILDVLIEIPKRNMQNMHFRAWKAALLQVLTYLVIKVHKSITVHYTVYLNYSIMHGLHNIDDKS